MNPELRTALTRAGRLTAASRNRVHFALVLKGSTAGILLASPTKVAAPKIEEAKRQCKGTVVVRGTCFTDGSKLVFEIKQKPTPAWNSLVGKLIRSETGLTVHPEFRAGKAPEEYGDDESVLEEVAPAPAPPGAAPAPAPSLAEQWAARLAAVTPGLTAALAKGQAALESALTEKARNLSRRFQEVKTLAAQAHYKEAVSGLAMVESLADEIMLERPEAPNAEAQAALESRIQLEWTQKLAAVNTACETLRAESLPEGGLASRRIVDARRLFAGRKPQQAYEALLEIEKEINHSLAARKWKRDVEGQIRTYRIDKVLGEGNQGVVRLLQSSTAGSPPLVLKQSTDRAELEQEATFYRAVGDHPNIARCLGMKRIEGVNGLVMESLTGGDAASVQNSLRKRLEKNEITPRQFWGTVQYTLLGVLQAVDHMQSRGVVHCDIKPQNVMYDERGQVKLVDFGGATKKDNRAGAVTPGFVAPELARPRPGEETPPGVRLPGLATESADVYSVGASAYTAGERKRFDYDHGADQPRGPMEDVLKAYLAAPTDPLKPGDADHPASTVDEAGERSKAAGRYAANTEYVKFVNWLMNPDPTKRPTAKQALEHPFLKDRLLSDEEARAQIRPATPPGAAPPPRTPSPAPPPAKPKGSRDFTALRPQVEAVLAQADDWHVKVANLRSNLSEFNPSDKNIPRLLGLRADFAHRKSSLGRFLPPVEAAISILEIRRPGADDPQAKEDDRALKRLQALRAEFARTWGAVNEVMTRLDAVVTQRGGVKQQAALAMKGLLFNQLDTFQRVEQVRQRRADLGAVVATLNLDKPAPAPFDQRLRTIPRLRRTVQNEIDQVVREDTAVKQVDQQLIAKANGFFANRTDKANVAAARGRIGQLVDALREYLVTLQKWQHDLAETEAGDRRAVGRAWEGVQETLNSLKRGIEAVQDIAADYREKGTAFQALAKKPRTTPPERAEFAGQRAAFVAALQEIAANISTQKAALPPLEERLQTVVPNFSPEPMEGGDDLYLHLEAALGRSKAAARMLQRLQTLTASDLQANV